MYNSRIHGRLQAFQTSQLHHSTLCWLSCGTDKAIVGHVCHEMALASVQLRDLSKPKYQNCPVGGASVEFSLIYIGEN